MTAARSLERHLVATAPVGGFSTAPLSIAERDAFRSAMIAERVAVGFCPLHAPLLTPPSANPKLGKSGTYGLSLAAASLSGAWNVCRYSTSGCRGVCLWSSGKGSLDSVQRGRVWKTRLLGSHPELFIRALASELRGVLARRPLDTLGRRFGRVPVRLNGLSDLPWESFAPALFTDPSLRACQWYDYSKNPTRAADLPANYHLTFSASERTTDLVAAAGHYGTVAVVFSTRRGAPLPATWEGLPVHDGDLSDSRWKDAAGIIGLRAKGLARGDDGGGFVRMVA